MPPRSPESAAQRPSRGFTLVELMVVIVILGGLIAIVGPNVFKALTESDIQRAETQMSNFGQAINMYYLRNRKLPTTLDELTEEDPRSGEPFIEKIPNDPWGNAYEYKVLGRKEFQIVSGGENGTPGDEDDIVWPKKEE